MAGTKKKTSGEMTPREGRERREGGKPSAKAPAAHDVIDSEEKAREESQLEERLPQRFWETDEEHRARLEGRVLNIDDDVPLEPEPPADRVEAAKEPAEIAPPAAPAPMEAPVAPKD